MVMYNGHDLAAAYNELGSLPEVSRVTGQSKAAIQASIKRAGYEMIKEYKLISRKEFKTRWEKINAKPR